MWCCHHFLTPPKTRVCVSGVAQGRDYHNPDFLLVEVEAAKRVGIRFGYRGYTSIQADAFNGAWKRLFDVDFRVMFSKDLPLAYLQSMYSEKRTKSNQIEEHRI